MSQIYHQMPSSVFTVCFTKSFILYFKRVGSSAFTTNIIYLKHLNSFTKKNCLQFQNASASHTARCRHSNSRDQPSLKISQPYSSSRPRMSSTHTCKTSWNRSSHGSTCASVFHDPLWSNIPNTRAYKSQYPPSHKQTYACYIYTKYVTSHNFYSSTKTWM